MSRVILVRHAQASFLEPNYDKLSALGETQALVLGEYWAQRSMVFDQVCAGPRARQVDTATIVGEAYRKAGLDFPEPVVIEEFDEFDGEAGLDKSLPQLLKSNQEIRELHEAFQASSDTRERRKNFQRLFEAVIRRWVAGKILVDDAESWLEFCARVNRGLSKFLTAGGRSEQAVIFCSGGPIAVAMQRALSLSAGNTLRVAWMIRNCSYSEFVFSGDRFTLSVFNAFPHLDDESLLTYR